MDFGDIIETKVDDAVEEAGAAAVTLKDAIHAAVKELIDNLIAIFHKILGIEAL